jgi:hypothetical protein
MTISTAQRTGRAQVPDVPIAVALGPAARSSLGQLQDHTGLSQADLANCAITWYAYFDTRLRVGYNLTLWNAEAGKSYTLSLSAGSPAAGSAQAAPGFHSSAARPPIAETLSRPSRSPGPVFAPAKPWLAGASSRGSPSAALHTEGAQPVNRPATRSQARNPAVAAREGGSS